VIPALPIMIPAIAAALMLTIGRGRVAFNRATSIISCLAQLVLAIFTLIAFTAPHAAPIFYQLSGWERTGPWALGIELTLGPLSAIMLFGSAVIAMTSVAMMPSTMADDEDGPLYPLVQFLLVGVNLTFVTNDLFNLFVAFEIMLLASYSLLAVGVRGTRTQHVFTYLSANLIASTLFLLGVGATYAALGTVNMTDLAHRITSLPVESLGLVQLSAALLLCAFGAKAAIMPVMGWLPEAYSALRGPLAGLFGGILTKVGVYALLRVLWGVFGPEVAAMSFMVMLALAAPTMVLGGFGAVSRPTIRGVLTLSIVAQIGYALFGLAMGTLSAIAATIFFLVHIMIVKAALFFIGSAMEYVTCAPDDRMDSFSGMAKSHPLLGAAFLLSAMAMIGFPPSTGFWGKVGLVTAGFESGHVALTVVALLSTLFTAFSLLQIWKLAFWRKAEHSTPPEFRTLPPLAAGGICLIVGVIVFMGLYPQPFIEVSRAAAQLLEVSPTAQKVALAQSPAPEAKP
jgi:multicomponent Na+:H+ antiporter subunit D